MDFAQAQAQFTQILDSLDAEALPQFLKWVRQKSDYLLEDIEETNEDKMISQISDDIRQELPRTATLPSETIMYPTVGENADCDPKTTVHVDAFLYPEDVVDELCDAGLMSRNYCRACASHDTSPLSFISHSISRNQLKYLFHYLLPDLRGRTVVDVGSRLGAVLYGAYFYSGSRNIIGVEMNADLCALQQRVIEKNRLQDRIKVIKLVSHSMYRATPVVFCGVYSVSLNMAQDANAFYADEFNLNSIMKLIKQCISAMNDEEKVICADICTQIETLQAADVIILHNVFEFFMPADAQEMIWKCLRETVKRPGVLLVTSPSLEQSTENLQISLDGWTKKLLTDKLPQANFSIFGEEYPEDSDLSDIFLYQVK